MKLFALTSLALVATTSMLAIGCSSTSSGSGNGGTGSASSALSTFRAPTGSFGAGNGSSVFQSMFRQQQQGAAVGGGSGGTGGLSTQSLAGKLGLLTNDTGETSSPSCSEGASCACEGGGTFTYAQESASEGRALHLTFSSCRSADGSGFDGEALFLVSQRALVEDDRLPPYGSGQSLLLVADGTVTENGQSETAKVALLSQPNVKLVAVEVNDGSVVLGQTSRGTVIIRAKGAAWTCNATSSGYVCKEDNTGETITVESGSEPSNDDTSGPVNDAQPKR